MNNFKKHLLLFSLAPALTTPLVAVISCSSSAKDYKVMDFRLSEEKALAIVKEGVESFNAESVSLDKLSKITIQNISDFDRYTQKAFELELFKEISISVNEQNQEATIKIEILDKKTIDGKTINYSYRLPNSSLKLSSKFKIK